jgi:hypothetical protein
LICPALFFHAGEIEYKGIEGDEDVAIRATSGMAILG